MKLKKKRTLNLPLLIILIINIVLDILIVIFINNLHILPTLYMALLVFVLLILLIGNFFLLKSKKKILNWISYIFTVVFIILSVFIIHYAERTNHFLDNSFDNSDNTYMNNYLILVLKENHYQDIQNLENTRLGYYDNMPNAEEALKYLNDKVTTENVKYEDSDIAINALKEKEITGLLFEKTLYNFILENDTNFDKNLYDVIYTFDVTIIEEKKPNDNQSEENSSKADSFNVYIGGVDFTEMYTDFNMIVTINNTTHKILLTSTPRDYYIPLAGKNGAKDLLGYAGVWGVNTSIGSLENLYNTNIDYYVKINTKSLVGLVDTLNGVEFCSDKSFTTTHALVLGTYNDNLANKLQVTKGCKNYNGIEILTIARERRAYSDGDRQRQKNCQQIMINIFNKMIRAENITNYTNILDAVSNLYTTNISKDLVTRLAKDTIANPNWQFIQQSVTGSDSRGKVHLSNYVDYVMLPNTDSVNSASSKINQILNET